ncbi:MAG: lipid-A-disaccharide synthase [Candidatus Aureabacteria bacterium]|nr:lipid-A-disaccharide synthase [Candidatus Auribacterota bacterium]
MKIPNKSQIPNPKSQNKEDPPPRESDDSAHGPLIVVVAGEVSGDKHAAKLIAEIRKREPRAEICAAGGDAMENAGARLLYNLVDMAVLGSVEVLRNYGTLRRIFYSLLAFIEKRKPDAVVLVDYPGFNIRLAKKIKQRRLPVRVIYYISPQVWAWGTRRKKTIRRNVDRMIVILPFEKEFYADTELPVEFVGHPMLDDLKVETSREEFCRRTGVGPRARVVALLPGSRWNEVRRHLPVMLAAAALMKRTMPELQFIMSEPPSAFRRFIENAIARSAVHVGVIRESIYEVIHASDIVLVASGTATLETACVLKPMVIMYKVAWPTYLLARLLVKLPYIGLVNVIAGRKIMPEFIQRDATPARIAAAALDFLADGAGYLAAVEALRAVRARVGEEGASARAAEAVLSALRTV